MLKKIIILFIIISIIIPIYTKAEENLLSNAKSGLLVEVSTGTIIFEKNMHERVSVASMTKMMGMILIMEALENGQIKLNEKVKVSKNASGMGGSQIWLEEGEEMLVSDLIKGIIILNETKNDNQRYIVCLCGRSRTSSRKGGRIVVASYELCRHRCVTLRGRSGDQTYQLCTDRQIYRYGSADYLYRQC